jgi:hypothetical protein
VNRTVNVVDTTPPVIVILGSNPAIITVGSYVDAGATASDNLDGNITVSIVATSSVNSSAIGSYNVTYDVTDSSGNSAQAVRIVNIVAAPAPASGGGGGGGGGSSYKVLSTGHGPPSGNPPAAPAAKSKSSVAGGGASLASEESNKPLPEFIREQVSALSGGKITGAFAGEPGSANWLWWILLLILIILAIIGIWYSRRKK